MILRGTRELMAWFEASRLSTKILVLSTLTIALPLLLLTGQLDRANTDTARRSALAALQGQAGTQAAEMDQQFRAWTQLVTQGSHTPAFADYLAAVEAGASPPPGRAFAVLDAERSVDHAFTGATLLDSHGRAVLGTDPADVASGDLRGTDYFVAARGGKAAISRLTVYPGTGKPAVVAAAPVFLDDQFVGVLAIRVDLSGLTSFANPTRVPSDRFAMLVDEQDVVIGYTGPTPEKVLYHTVGGATPARLAALRTSGTYGAAKVGELGMTDLASMLSSTTAGAAHSGQVRFPLTRRAAEVASSTLQARPWRVAVLQDELAFLAPFQTSTVNTVLFFVGAAMLITMLVFVAVRMLERTEAQSLHDELTGLANRRYFNEIMRRELGRAQRNHRPLSVIAIDLDHFKRINDQQGHEGGDEVLKSFATTVAENVRSIDMPARYGGEEFMVLLPDTDKEGALMVAEKLRVECEHLRLDRRATDAADRPAAEHVTMSAGVSTFPEDGDDEELLIRRADQAMYLSKSLGRNQVSGFGSAVPLTGLADDPGKVNLLVRNANRSTVEALAAAIDARDSYTHGHSRRVAEYAGLIGRELDLQSSEKEVLDLGALLHDVGKIGVPDSLLRKAGRLSEAESSSVRDHTTIGFAMVQNVPFLEQVAPIILHHHENVDGSGYPRGLAGDAIPLAARIVKVADAFDAMTSQRTYREASPVEWAFGELRRNAGQQFDPQVVEALAAAHAKHRVLPIVPRGVASKVVAG